jgi:excisionase family DNA binding protein
VCQKQPAIRSGIAASSLRDLVADTGIDLAERNKLLARAIRDLVSLNNFELIYDAMSSTAPIRRADEHKDSIMPRKPRNRRERRHPPERLGLQEAADYCDVDYRTIRRWLAAGHLNAYRVGPKLIKVDVAELDKLITPVGGGAK